MRTTATIEEMTSAYVLFTDTETYVVEYLLGELILSNSISEALVFTNELQALRFKQLLFQECQLTTSVNTYIG
ncbi:hypothetical protein NBT05_12755 [Aquimarina sp. ERC-38]|uniref:hypothetical protein n=1 Tax=Aquimarina sp. ERC-38 TaxID=2949996 RepID=UPI00224722CA|nr:hypothetical protein [Aquimarina sp. ERC-38]UZO79819.1 hypothetical protein NBT05_12755 [Aquimarina sp. ERC-38]